MSDVFEQPMLCSPNVSVRESFRHPEFPPAMIPNIPDTPENRFKLGIYLTLIKNGKSPAEAAAVAKSAWERKQRFYHSWHANLLGAVATTETMSTATQRWVDRGGVSHISDTGGISWDSH